MECDTNKLRELFARGLCSGVSNSTGQVCIEAAISLACGGDLSDSPSCVAEADRAYSIAINEAPWSSPQARAEALWPLALAQIGTAGKDCTAWFKALAEGTIRRVLPIALRAAGLEREAARCEREGSRDAAHAVANAAYRAHSSANVARAAAANAARAAAYAVGHAASDAAHAATMAHYAAADAARAAAGGARADADAESLDSILRASVQVALDAYAAEQAD